MTYLILFWEFFKTGLFAVGGGMATVPFLQSLGVKTGWYTSAQLADMIAVSESTPGPLGVNMATYVGYTVGLQDGGPFFGALGALTATIGLIFPSVVIIMIVAGFLDKFRDNRYVKAAFYGLRPASVGLIAAAGFCILLLSFFGIPSVYAFGQSFDMDWRLWILAAVLLAATRWIPKVKNLHAICFIVFSAVVGIVFGLSE